MSSSKKSKTNLDDISRETQRLIKDSHVCLPYHKPKQKSLKDFLNRQKMTSEYQVSITGSKKLLHKAWEFIENKEQSIEKFYNEDSSQNEELSFDNDNIQSEKNIYLGEDNINASNIDNEIRDNDDNFENNSVIESELSINDAMSTYNDDEENSKQASLYSEESPIKQQHNEGTENDSNLNNFEDDTDSCDSVDNKVTLKPSRVSQFIDDEAELSELDYNSDSENNLSGFLNESEEEEEEEVSTKKKRRLILLSESSDDDNDDNDDENKSNTEIKLISNDLISLFNEPETSISTQQLMSLCSGQFQTQQSEIPEEDDQELEDDFDSEVHINDADSTKSVDYANNFENEFDEEMPKLTSVKDFFDDEAELSESDWSSDDEEHLVDTIDKLEEEAGDKDKLDEDVVKDGLDKIYMRQLLDDDQQQVSALKEMLLEDGELHSDSGRKRKFQWDDNDQNDTEFKKPLFSDNEDENDEVLSDDDQAEQWRKERYKRESFLSKKYDSDDDEMQVNNDDGSSDTLQTSIPVVKKTHIIKYQNIKSDKVTSNAINVENNYESLQSSNESKYDERNRSTSIKIINEVTETNKSNKFVKGSFMKRSGGKIATTLMYINKKSLVNNDEINNRRYEENSEIKSMTTITSKAGSNPFAYLLRKDKKQEIKNTIVDDSMVLEKKENIHQSKSYTSVQLTQQIHQTKSQNQKSINSILKQLE